MPKKKAKKRGARGASGGGSGQFLGDGAPSDLEAMGHELENITFSDLEDARDEDAVVEVVYVEPALKRVEWVPSGGRISRDWLRQCVTNSHGAWRDRLPNVQPAHLSGRLIPEEGVSFSDIAVGKGLVVVELEEAHTDHGLVGAGSLAAAAKLTMEERLEEMTRCFQEMRRHFEEIDLQRSEKIEAQQRQIEFLTAKIEAQDAKNDAKIEAEHAEIVALRSRVQQLQVFIKKGLLLSDKVKKRVVLSLARTEAEKAIGRTKQDSESWAAFIWGFSSADWTKVGVSRKLVKDLLADGAYQFNDSIHVIPANEVVGSIVGMRYGSSRSAWEEIFFMAFKKRVSDEVFEEELDYATHRRQLLGDS